ncbi:methyltransferase [Gordonia phage Suzy]|uniref:Methyltransferase n=1 Tax=Gordonia phage Suzy TaxID=2201430 RepID=A0A2Z4Q8I4_9CAUD|nr:methyltransferase [Gordonia phage Suzy]AWY06165.1 methyltransferase [Gordonia phage Suzy]
MTEEQVFKDPTDIWDHIDIAMVRDRAQYTYKMNGLKTRGDKIQLGAGFKVLDGWRNLEYPDWNADLPIMAEGVSANDFAPGTRWDDVSSHWKQADSTISEIASYHTLDHLSPTQVINTLREVERVLVPGGTFTNIVPHADSQLAKECIHHQSRFMIDTWRNIFSERQYAHDGDWQLEVGLNFVFGLAERNVVLVTQLVKR